MRSHIERKPIRIDDLRGIRGGELTKDHFKAPVEMSQQYNLTPGLPNIGGEDYPTHVYLEQSFDWYEGIADIEIKDTTRNVA